MPGSDEDEQAPPQHPEAEGEGCAPPSSPPLSSLLRELMEVDLDFNFDSSPWQFDPNSFSFFSPAATATAGSSMPPFVLPSPPRPVFDPNSLLSSSPTTSAFWGACDEKSAGGSRPESGVDAPQVTTLPSSETNTRNGRSILEDRVLLSSITEENSDTSRLLKERMTQALRYFKESTDQHILVQVWAPVKNGDRYVLTTSGQPFVLDPHSTGLLQYRTVSLTYMFSVDGDDEGELGLPGRVFRQKLPEWTPNVQYYSSNEYPRLSHALNYNVRGTLALPVFEPSGQSCVGVVELILTSQKINYAPEVDKVCKALEAVNLRSSEILDHPSLQICNEGRQAALAEILEILTTVCETHKLPLAQTWVPCKHRTVLAYGGGSKKNCSSFDGSCMGQVCMSTTDVAFYVVDAQIWGFRDACVEHHLQKGQGVAGMAFSTGKPCFSRDITKFGKNDYPLVHYARMFGLGGCLAICLQSYQTGNDDYILEFFLPIKCKENEEQDILLDLIVAEMKQCFRSLKVVSGTDLQEKMSFKIIDNPINDTYDLKSIDVHDQSPGVHHNIAVAEFSQLNASQFGEHMPQDLAKQHRVQEPFTQVDTLKNDVYTERHIDVNRNKNQISIQGNVNNKKGERRRGKPEKSIKLEVLQQYFSGSLKDAAKSLGVCPTTMKRICRQHGISRWPSRKINKVNRSLSKLKQVIESVQGADGAYDLTSLTSSTLPVVSDSKFWSLNPDLNQHNSSGTKPTEPVECKAEDSEPQRSVDGDGRGQRVSCQDHVYDQDGCRPGVIIGFRDSKTSSSGEGSTETPVSQNSCEGNLLTRINLENPGFPIPVQGTNGSDHLMYMLQPTEEPSPNVTFLMHDAARISDSQQLLGGLLVEDSGSSKDLRNLCASAGEACLDEQANPTEPFKLSVQDVWSVTIKANYKDDIIRFRLPFSSGITVLKDEIAKRLKLEMGTFDIKYLDDDLEWVLLACDSDLEEYMATSRLLGGRVIRLSVHDIISNLGSSCESNGS